MPRRSRRTTELWVILNSIRADSALLADDINKMEKERDRARGQLTQFKGDYIQSIVAARAAADELNRTITDLANKEEIQKFLATASAQLGKQLEIQADPSMKRLFKQLTDMESGVISEDVPLRFNAGTWMISVTINETNTIAMVLDTGASSVCLPYRDAEKFGLAPSSSDPQIQMQIADGSIIRGRRVIIPSVRVGKFMANNVECVILEPSAINAPRLLGNSFLKHFNLDLRAGDGVLKMQEIK